MALANPRWCSGYSLARIREYDGKLTDSPMPNSRRKARIMAKTVAAPVIAVAPDQRKKPQASTQPTWKRPTTQPARKLSWQSA